MREAREVRDITAIALADMLGVTRQAVSQYETGRQSPAPPVMRRIAEILKIPMHRFLRPVSGEESGTIFYRSMATATKTARVKATRRYEWLREIVAFLRRFVDFPAVRFSDFQLGDDPRGLSERQIEELATKTRRHWGLGDGPISNVLWLVENNGAVVARHELFANKLDAFSEWRASDPAPMIVLGADKCAAVRSRFDVAHELAHIVLHRGVRRAFVNHPATYKLIEEQAHRFAGAFLLPEQSFASDFSSPSLDAMVSLKSKWRVAIGGMVKRARHLGLITAKRERQLWSAIARRRWRLREPLDDMLEPEQPRLLRRSFDLVVGNGLMARHEIPFDLALPAADIEQLAGLPPGYLDEAPPRAELRMPSAPLIEDESANPGEPDVGQCILRFPMA